MLHPWLAQSGSVKLPLPKMGVWSPPRLPKTQKTIWKVKTPRLEVFFIPLERLEAKMSKMSSHSWFGHFQIKLWAKERSGVKLAIWLLTTKSRESTSFRCPIRECDTVLERSRRGLQLWFRPRCDQRSGRRAMTSQGPGSPTRTHSGQFRDSNLGVPGICDIQMWVPPRVTELTIGSKVVAYS
jgi:hypothetical protein